MRLSLLEILLVAVPAPEAVTKWSYEHYEVNVYFIVIYSINTGLGMRIYYLECAFMTENAEVVSLQRVFERSKLLFTKRLLRYAKDATYALLSSPPFLCARNTGSEIQEKERDCHVKPNPGCLKLLEIYRVGVPIVQTIKWRPMDSKVELSRMMVYVSSIFADVSRIMSMRVAFQVT
jgi:hypothetical protein